MKDISFKIRVGDILGMQLLASADDTRYVLNGVFFEHRNGNLLLVACDGRRLGVLNVGRIVAVNAPVPEDFFFLVDCSCAKLLRAKKGDFIDLRLSGSEVTFSKSKGRLSFVQRTIDGNYPNWRVVIPNKPFVPAKPALLNFDFVCSFRDTAKLLENGRNSGAVRVLSHDEHGMEALSVFCGDERFYGVLMPMRDDRNYAVPDWVKPIVTPVETPRAEATEPANTSSSFTPGGAQ